MWTRCSRRLPVGTVHDLARTAAPRKRETCWAFFLRRCITTRSASLDLLVACVSSSASIAIRNAQPYARSAQCGTITRSCGMDLRFVAREPVEIAFRCILRRNRLLRKNLRGKKIRGQNHFNPSLFGLVFHKLIQGALWSPFVRRLFGS